MMSFLCDVWGRAAQWLGRFGLAIEGAEPLSRQGRAGSCFWTNSPAPSRVVVALLDGLGVSREAYDAVVSSGDVTVSLLLERADQTLFFIGAKEDTAIFEEVLAARGKRT